MPYLLVLPAVLFCLTFRFVPLVLVGILSTYKADFIENEFIAFKNYAKIFTDPDLYAPIANTVWYIIGIVPLTLLLSLFVATQAQHTRPLTQKYLRIVFYTPALVSGIIMGTIWRWVFHYDGVVNWILGQKILWFSNRTLSVLPITFISVLAGSGFYIIIFMAVLKSIPQERYDIATIEGANRWQVKRYVMLPGISKSVSLMLILLTASTLQIWGLIYFLAPYPYSATIVYALFREGFLYGRFGLASAYSVILMTITITVMVIQRKVSK